MVDFQSRDTRRGVSDDDEEADGSDEAAETADDDPAVDDDIEVEEVVEEPASSGDGSAAEDSTTDEGGPPTDNPGSGDVGISAAEPPSAEGTDSGTDPLATGTDTGEAESQSADAGPSDGDVDSGGAASSGIDRIGDAPDSAADSEPSTDDQASVEAEPATTDAATPSAESTEPQQTKPSRTVGIALLTVGGQSETPPEERLEAAIESAGHDVVVSEHVEGEYDGLQQAVDELVALPAVDVVVTAGGIGIAPDERTIEAVHPLLEKALPGFGEAFRHLLSEQIGTGIVAVRSTAGIADGTPVFCLPADAAAARLAIEEIVATEAPELVAHLDG